MMYDLFVLPEICLIADVIQTFLDQGANFSPEYVQADVRKSVEFLHASGRLHNKIMKHPVLSRHGLSVTSRPFSLSTYSRERLSSHIPWSNPGAIQK